MVLVQWSFKLDTSEYSFKFCFEDQGVACKWHELLTQVIDNLRVTAGLPPILPAKHPSATTWAPAEGAALPATSSIANSDLEKAAIPMNAADATGNSWQGSQLRIKG